MSVGAAVAEGVDARASWSITGWPVHRLGRHLDLPVLEVDVRVRIVEVHVGWDLGPVQGHGSLDQAGQTGSSFEMADVGLDGTNDQRLLARLGEEGTDRLRLARITCCRAGAMRLEVLGVGSVEAGIAIRTTDERLLSLGRREGDALLPAVVVGTGGPNNCSDGVAVSLGPAGALQDDGADALAPNVAGSGGIESAATSIGREHSKIGHGDEDVGIEMQCRPNDDTLIRPSQPWVQGRTL